MDELRSKSCGICNSNSSKYQCPRCNILYCSSGCYKNPNHSECSEEFYKECVRNELSSRGHHDSESQSNMSNILKRIYDNADEFNLDDSINNDMLEELDSDDDDVSKAYEDIQARFSDVDLDKPDEVWEKLNEAERLEFKNLVTSLDSMKIVPEFDPWWEYKDRSKIIVLEELSAFEKDHKHKCPDVDSKKIVPLSQLSKTSPVSNICYNLANVLSAYVFTVRYYNGDHQDNANESAASIIALSQNLFRNDNFFSLESAVESVYSELINMDFLKPMLDVSETIKMDVKNIFDGPDDSTNNKNFYALSTLSDMHKLFSKAIKKYDDRTSSSENFQNSNFSRRFPDIGVASLEKVPKTKIRICKKKIEYYMSWCIEYYLTPFWLP